MANQTHPLYFLLFILLLLQGCAAAVVTGGAAGASMAMDKRTTGTFVEDQAIELKAFQTLSANKELKDQIHVSVTSYNTIVLVTGQTPNETLRQDVIDIISNIEKVTHVHNEITIAAPSSLMTRSSDGVITGKVKSKLLVDENVEGIHVKVVTENGVVYLMGLVSREQADNATEIARKTGGVQKVVRLFEYTD